MAFTTEHHPGVDTAPSDETNGLTLNHSMLRIKDQQWSLAFYTAILGMRVIRKLDFEELGFSLYFLGFPKVEDQTPDDSHERTKCMFGRCSASSCPIPGLKVIGLR